MKAKISKWLFLGLFLPCLPFAISALAILNEGHALSGQFAVPHLWERGELLLIALTLAAAGIYEVVSADVGSTRELRLYAILFSGFVVSSASVWYALISSSLLLRHPYDPEFVRVWSPLLFIFGAGCGLLCVLLSKNE